MHTPFDIYLLRGKTVCIYTVNNQTSWDGTISDGGGEKGTRFITELEYFAQSKIPCWSGVEMSGRRILAQPAQCCASFLCVGSFW